MTVYINNSTTCPVGTIYQEVSATAFQVAIYKVIGSAAELPAGSGLIPDGKVLHSALSGQMLAVSRPTIIDLADMVKRGDWHDYSRYVVPANPLTLIIEPTFNLYADTNVSKLQTADYSYREQQYFALFLYVPCAKAATIAECSLHINVAANGSLPLITTAWPTFDASGTYQGVTAVTPSFATEEVTLTGTDTLAPRALPNFVLTGPASLAADATGTFTLTAQDAAGNTLTTVDGFILHLDSTGGYLPQRRATLLNGTASFKATALGLAAGETIRLKVGTKLYPSILEQTVTVQ